MKKTKYILLSFFLLFTGINTVKAASVSISSSANTVTKGSNVTFYIRINNAASWVLSGKGTGATSNCVLGDERVGDTGTGSNGSKKISVTCKATDIGQIAFSVTGSVWDENFAETSISTSKGVTVTAPREKDTNNYLKSLTVSGYTITPEFNQDTMEYSVEVPNTVDKVTIEAEAQSSYASISGTGEVEVNEGANTFEIKVTSETGVERIYKININVKDENPINIKINNSDYTVMKNVKNIELPSTYEATTVKIEDFDIPAFYSSTSGFTLVSVKDSKGDQYFAIYDAENNTYELYNENQSDQLLLYILPITEEKKGFYKTKITILKQSYEALKAENADVYLLYAMDIVTGEKNYYIYDQKNNSYILYNENWISNYEDQLEKYKIGILGFGGVCIFCLIIITVQAIKGPKKKKAKKNSENISEEIPTPEEKKSKKNKKKEKISSEDSKIEEKKTEVPSPTKLTNEEAMKKMDDVTKMIEDYEKTVTLDKKELKEKAKEQPKEEVKEETMFDILSDDKKKKKKRK